MQQPTAARPDPITRTFGSITVTASRTVEGGYAINVFAGPTRVDALCYTSGDRNLYQARYTQLRDYGRQGYTPEQIAARINGQSAATVAEAEAIVTATLAELAKQGTHRQVRPTMAGAHLAPLTGPQQRALNTNIDGIVYVGDGITAATLRSLDRKGYGKVTFEGRRKRIVSLTLNGRGQAAVTAVTR